MKYDWKGAFLIALPYLTMFLIALCVLWIASENA